MAAFCRVAAAVPVFCVTMASAAGFAKVSGYTPLSDVSQYLKLGPAVEAVDAALSTSETKPQRDWAKASEEYLKLAGESSLRDAQKRRWEDLKAVPPADGSQRTKGDGSSLLDTFVTHYKSEDYVHQFVEQALKGEGKFALGNEAEGEKVREELTMKGIVLQGLLMASITHLQLAVDKCLQNSSTHAVQFVDAAWATYACSDSKGPIKLAEKRAPQFAVEAEHPTEAGDSKVNSRLLSLFKSMQADAQGEKCEDLRLRVKQSVSLMQVPVIQGLLREAYEADPAKTEEHKGADGFVEVAEGWAFARAVLPAIAKCSESAGQVVVKNMDTIAKGSAGSHVEDGFEAVKSAVESTYICLGISCDDVNAMVAPWKTDQFLWKKCDDSCLEPGSCTTTAELKIDGAYRAISSFLGSLIALTSLIYFTASVPTAI